MQRMQIRGDVVELTDQLDIVRFTSYPGRDIHIGRQESTVESATHPELIIVEGDNITGLGEWLVDRAAANIDESVEAPATFVEANDTFRRIAAIALPAATKPVETEDDELRAAIGELTESLGELLNAVSDDRLVLPTELDERIRDSGLLIPDDARPVLFAEHKAGQLNLFPHKWNHISAQSASKIGEWIIEGKKTLKKKSIWDV